MPFSFHPWEGQTWVGVGSDIFQGKNFYDVGSFLSHSVSSRENEAIGFNTHYEYYAYPPLWALIQYPFYLISQVGSVDFSFGGYPPDPLGKTANFFLKVPMLLFDFLSAFAVYKVLRALNVKKAWLGIWIWLFNPLLWFISAVWGHFDIIPVFFCLISIWALISRKAILGGGFLAVGISLKMYPVILIPCFVIFIYDYIGFRSVLKFLMSLVLVSVSLTLPYVITATDSALEVLFFHGNRMGGGLSLYNSVWLVQSIFHISPLEWGIKFSRISFSTMVWVFFVLHLYIICVSKRRGDPNELVNYAILVLAAFFVTTKLVNEPYAIWILPFLAIKIAASGRYKLHYIFMTLLPLLFLLVHTPITHFFRPLLDSENHLASLVESQEVLVNTILFVFGSLFVGWNLSLILRGIRGLGLRPDN